MNENQNKNLVLIKDLGIIFPTKNSKFKCRYGLYMCYCGKEFISRFSRVKNGHTKSCGCYKAEIKTTHGLAKHRLYKAWNDMKTRCINANSKSYKDYGGRGIKVCDRWHDVRNFIEDMYPSFKEGLMLDRINNNGNYEPSNCRWTTMTVQGRNTRILYAHNTSGYRGVGFKTGTSRYFARIKVNGKNIHIGYGSSALECAKLYDQYVINNNLEHTRNFS